MHTHDEWTLLLVDRGGVRDELHHDEHDADPAVVILLPPHVPHDGRTTDLRGTCCSTASRPPRWRPRSDSTIRRT